MKRTLATLALVATLAVGTIGATPAHAITIPTSGTVNCNSNGTITVAKVNPLRRAVRLTISAGLSGCTFNGTALPAAGGTISTSLTKKTAAAMCTAITNGGSIARTGITVTAAGYTLASVSVAATMSAPVPSGDGSAFDLDGTLVAPLATISAHASMTTATPITDLCSGNATVAFTGALSATWTRNF